jgi:hypothetical protein
MQQSAAGGASRIELMIRGENVGDDNGDGKGKDGLAIASVRARRFRL